MIRKKENSKKSHVILGSLIIILGLILIFKNNIYEMYINKKDEKQIKEYFKINNPKPKVINNDVSINRAISQKNNYSNYSSNYYAILEIPKISLKKGLVNRESKLNNVSKNIQTLDVSDTPDVVGGSVILASHSGNSSVSYFKNLYKLNKEDNIYIYYKNYKYEYKVIDIYNQDKTGIINFENKDKSTLVLTTCNQENKKKQIVVVANLNNKVNY